MEQDEFNIWEFLAEFELLYCILLFFFFIGLPILLTNTLLREPVTDDPTSNGQNSVENLQSVVDIIQNDKPADQTSTTEK